MLRVVTFTGEGSQKKFDRVWEGWLFGTRAAQQRNREPNVEVARRRAKISRKLQGVSEESKRIIVGDVHHRDLKAEAEIHFEQPELDLLVKTLEEADWMPEAAPEAFDVIDWLSASEKKEK